MNMVTSPSSQSFPEKLMTLLDGAAPDALYWLRGNQSFAIDTEKFGAAVLDRFFQGAKYTTFIRKLNQWGFRKIPNARVPSGVDAFHHVDFKRAFPELMKNMRDSKKKIKGGKAQAAISQVVAATRAPANSSTPPMTPSKAPTAPDLLMRNITPSPQPRPDALDSATTDSLLGSIRSQAVARLLLLNSLSAGSSLRAVPAARRLPPRPQLSTLNTTTPLSHILTNRHPQPDAMLQQLLRNSGYQGQPMTPLRNDLGSANSRLDLLLTTMKSLRSLNERPL